jgi:hypothetical protein
VDFTREPIIETVITPKEGFKLVVRSSKGVGQEEYFVDAVEVVTFGNSLFFRSSERPKNFLVPVNDYEVLEVREARMILKNVGIDRSIKIGGGREAPIRREAVEKAEAEPSTEEAAGAEVGADGRDKKKDRRTRHRRRRGGRDEKEEGDAAREGNGTPVASAEGALAGNGQERGASEGAPVVPVIIPPPPTLISETIGRYKDNALFKGAFYTKEELEARDSVVGEAGSAGSQPVKIQQEEGGYPSLDAIDEVIGQPAVSKKSEDAPATDKDDLWDFTEEPNKKEE